MEQSRQFGEYLMSHSVKLQKNGKSTIAFMPIKPVHVEKILTKEKLYEYRKTTFNKSLRHIIIYASAPIKKIVGLAEVGEIQIAAPTVLWERTKHAAGITRKQYREYFKNAKQACAIEIKNLYPLNKLISPNEINNEFKVPQSFSYVDETFYNKVSEKGMI